MIKYNMLAKVLFILILTIQLYSKSAIYYIQKYSTKYKVDSRVIQALIKTESDGIINAESKKLAQGLTQIMLETAREYYQEKYKKEKTVKMQLYYLSVIKLPDILLKKHIKYKHINIKISCWLIRKNLDYYKKKNKTKKDNYIYALNSYIHGCNGASYLGKFAYDYVHDIMNNIINFKDK